MQPMFAHKSRPPIRQAIALIDQALVIADRYRSDNDYTPNAEDIRQFDALLETLWNGRCTLEYIMRNLQHRIQA